MSRNSKPALLRLWFYILERPSWTLAGLLVVALGSTLGVAHRSSDRSAEMNALDRARLLAESHARLRDVYARDVVVPALSAGVELGSPGDRTIPFPVALPIPSDGATYTIMSPYGFPCRKDSSSPADPFSRRAWDELIQEPSTAVHVFESTPEGKRLRYAVAERVGESCRACHQALPSLPTMVWQSGDVVGMLEVDVVVEDPASVMRSAMAGTIGMVAITLILLVGGISLVGRRSRLSSRQLEKRVLDRTVELQVRETKTRSMIEAALDAVISIDEHGVITDWNRHAEIDFGWTAEEAIGLRVEELIVPERHREAHLAGLGRFLATGEARAMNQRIEIEALHQDGHEFPVELGISTSLHDGRHRFHAFVRDITEHRRAQTELQEAKLAAEIANRAKSAFLANMSHEIRTPMTAIIGFADVLIEDGNLDDAAPEVVRAVHTIRQNGEYLVEIINDILDISKIEAGKLEVERIPSSAVQLVSDVQSLMRVRAEEKGLSFQVEYSGPIPESIQSDPIRLRQILVNLIGNAIKFTAKGEVRLMVHFDEPQLHFDVVDTGIGLTEEHAARLFEPFAQADVTTSRTFGGTGLGLTISKRLAEMLGGDVILAESQWGSGSRFRATVDVGSMAGVKLLGDPRSVRTVDTMATSADDFPTRLDGFRVLLAEDGPDNQRLVSHILRKVGAEVTIVENGQLALDTALAAQEEGRIFDVILMDMQMPVMDGYQATRLLRQNRYLGPIVALTAHAMSGDREKCIESGCDDFASKPINRKRLVRTIYGNARERDLSF